MADPNQIVEAADVAKVGGGAGLWAFVSMLATRFFKKEDDSKAQMLSMLAEIKAGQVQTQASVVSLSSDVRVLTDRGVRSDGEQARMALELTELRLKVATLEGKFEHLNEQLAK